MTRDEYVIAMNWLEKYLTEEGWVEEEIEKLGKVVETIGDFRNTDDTPGI